MRSSTRATCTADHVPCPSRGWNASVVQGRCNGRGSDSRRDGICFDHHRFGGATMMVRCIDNLFQSDILTEGHLYEVRTERDDCYVLSGFDKPLSKVRFEPVTPRQPVLVRPL